MYFNGPSPYELGGSPDIEAEDAALEELDIMPRPEMRLGLIRLDGTDPIDMDGIRNIQGFSLTAIYEEPIESRLGISDIDERLREGLEGTYYDRISGTARMDSDGTARQPFMRPL